MDDQQALGVDLAAIGASRHRSVLAVYAGFGFVRVRPYLTLQWRLGDRCSRLLDSTCPNRDLRPLRRLARVSYAGHLWHYPIFICTGGTIDDMPGVETETATIATLVVAIISNRYIETWLRSPCPVRPVDKAVRPAIRRPPLQHHRRSFAWGTIGTKDSHLELDS